MTKFGGQFRREAPKIFFSYPQYFNLGGHLFHIDESLTHCKVQTPVSVKHAVKRMRRLRGEGVKEGKDRYCCRDYKRIFKLYRDNGIPYSVVDNIYLHTN